MTTDEARQQRQEAEAEILEILKRLQRETGLDLVRVEVRLVVRIVDDAYKYGRSPDAVRIDLAV